MGDDLMNDEYPDNDQRAAICHQQWRDRNKGENMEAEHKSISLELKDDSPGSFLARIAKLNVIDSDGDVTVPGAFPADKEVLVSAYQHSSWMNELPVGKAILKEDGEAELAEGQFNLATETGKEHYEAVKFTGGLQEWSYGFRVLEVGSEEDIDQWAEGHEGARPVRILKKVDPFEISPVLKGAGVDTATLAIKSKDDISMTYLDQANAALAAVEEFTIRTSSLAELRQKEGRSLSPANKERLQELRANLELVNEGIKAMLADNEPVDEAVAVRLFAEFTTLQTKLLEVC
jgi:phage head maturation protease